MTSARDRFENMKLVREWLGDRLAEFCIPHRLTSEAFFEALLCVCVREVAQRAGKDRAHEVLDLASWEIVGGKKVEPPVPTPAATSPANSSPTAA